MAEGIRTRYRGMPGFRLGYAQQDTDYAAFETTPVRRYTQRTYDVGVDYSRPLSIVAQDDVLVWYWSVVLDNGVETFFNVTGSASLSHQIGRTWRRTSYTPRSGSVAGSLEPTFSDSVNANLQGHLNSRTTFHRHRSVREWKCRRGACRTTMTPFSDHSPRMGRSARQTAIYVSYYYYGYEYDEDTPTVVPMPSQIRSSRRSSRDDLQISAHPRKRFSCYQVNHTHRKILCDCVTAKWVIILTPVCDRSRSARSFAHFLPSRYRSETVILVVLNRCRNRT